jgi:hypothetical protein
MMKERVSIIHKYLVAFKEGRNMSKKVLINR